MAEAFKAAMENDPPLAPPPPKCGYPRMLRASQRWWLPLYWIYGWCDQPRGHSGRHAEHWRHNA